MCNNTLHHMAQQRKSQQKLVAHEPGNLHKFVISNLDFSQFACLLLLQLFRFIHIPNSVCGGSCFVIYAIVLGERERRVENSKSTNEWKCGIIIIFNHAFRPPLDACRAHQRYTRNITDYNRALLLHIWHNADSSYIVHNARELII